MTLRSTVWMAALACSVLAHAGCNSDAETACEKAKECGLLEDSVSECVKELERELSDSERTRCANCVDEHSCSEIEEDEACEAACGD